MSWVTWKQHSQEVAWALALGGLVAAAIAFVAYQMHLAGCPGLAAGYCTRNDLGGQVALQLIRLNLYQYGLVVLPALAGAFIGCPLVAREMESGTHRLAWTQGVTRLRWLLVKLALLFVPLALLAGLAGLLEIVLIDQTATEPNRWAFFDQQAPMTVAATLFALALGLAVGAVVGRSIPAMAVTLVAFVVVRIGLAELARPIYMSPVTYITHDLTTLDSAANPTAWWVDNPSFYDSASHFLGTGRPSAAASYAIQHFQPDDRFWAFQAIESAILLGLAVTLVGFAIYWVTRRVS